MGERFRYSNERVQLPSDRALESFQHVCLAKADIFTIIAGFCDAKVIPPSSLGDFQTFAHIRAVVWPELLLSHLYKFEPTSRLNIDDSMVFTASEVYCLWKQEILQHPYIHPKLLDLEDESPEIIPIESIGYWLEYVGGIPLPGLREKFQDKYGVHLLDQYLIEISNPTPSELLYENEGDIEVHRHINLHYFPSICRLVRYLDIKYRGLLQE